MTIDLETRVREAAAKIDVAARRYVPRASPQPDAPGVSRRAALIGAGTLTVAAVVGGVAFVKARNQADENEPVASDPPSPSSPTVTAATPATEPAPTTAETAETTAAKTASTVGDQDPGGWKDIAAAPLSGREDAGAVWTGDEFLVWGGRVGNFLYQQGAAYNPATDTWREITANQWAGLGTATTWTGTQMVVLFKNGGVVYDLAEDTWSDLGTGDVNQWFDDASWTGDRVLGIGGRSTGGQAAFIATATITPGDPTFRPGSVSPISWTPDVQLVAIPSGGVAWQPTPGATGAQAWAYDVELDTWTELPALQFAGEHIASSIIVPTTTGWTALLTTMVPATSIRTTRTARIEAAGWRTSELAVTFEATQGIGVADDAIIAFGLQDGTPTAFEIDADGTLRDTWTLDPQATTGQALAWNGTVLFAWGGRVDESTVAGVGRLWTP